VTHDHLLAQLNIAAMKEPLESPSMADFVANLDRINSLADSAPGFVWRFTDDPPDNPFGPMTLINMSVWRDVDSLSDYVHKSAHVEVLRRPNACSCCARGDQRLMRSPSLAGSTLRVRLTRPSAAEPRAKVKTMTPLALQLALHGSVVLLSGLIGGLLFARAIKLRRGEVPWRVVHAGGCSAGAMLLAMAVPSQWLTLGQVWSVAMGAGLIVGTYLLCAGMYVAAIWEVRGIPGGGSALNRVVSGLYGLGTILTLIGCAMLVLGLLRSVLAPAVG
jgi:hypothetical protein